MNTGVNLPALRGHNAALVLDLLRAAGEAGISRLELAEGTGLTPQAVSKITARLRAEGLAAEAGRRASTGGKPRTVLRLVPDAGHAVGLHLDRDELTAVLVDLTGTVVAERRAPLAFGAGAETVVETAAEEVRGLLTELAEQPPGLRGALPGAAPGVERAAGPGPVPGVGRTVEPGEGAGVGPAASDAGPGEVSRALPGAGRAVAPGPAPGVGRAAGPGEVAGVAPAASDAGLGYVSGQVPGAGRPAAPGAAPGVERAAGSGAVPGVERAAGSGAVPGGGRAAGSGVTSGRGPAAGPGPRVSGVGVALPGPLDHVGGVLRRVTGFPAWDGYPLRDALAGRLGLPVVVDKDTNAAALGLALAGADAGGSFAYLHLGTGLGAGLVLAGSVHRGARTGAGEFGHQVLQLDGPPCACGDRGCVEALCLAAVARGDLDEAARVLGTAAGNLVGLLDIDRVLLGGRTVFAAEELFVRGVGTVVAARARRGGGAADVPVALAPGGERAVAEGAAQLVLAPLFGRAEVAFPAHRRGQDLA
ncbi:ROK family protein [Streptomyces sp. NPDC023327]|uniref:ROK family protein n=1 Tax=Streptomyces sp. NPDC023327 TaxID=3157088 RepID=UPI0033DF7B94